MRLFSKKNLIRAAAVAALLAVFTGLVVAGLIGYARWKLSHLVLGGRGESFTTRIYSAPFQITDNIRISPERLVRRLERLEYRRVDTAPAERGQYTWEPPVLTVYLRGFYLPYLSQDPALVQMVSGPENRWLVAPPAGAETPAIALEPEVISELSGPQRTRREPATWDEIPEFLKNAVIAVEDRRFYRHYGLDPHAILRAAWSNLSRRNGLQGGSTLTQQLAKNLLLRPERTFRRKLAEAALALYLEKRYTKPEILTLYLNHIYLGQDGPVSVAGVKSAAQYFFGKPVAQLTLAESAVLAGMIHRPSHFNPLRDPGAATRRRDAVLGRMRAEGMITQSQMSEAQAEPLVTRPQPAKESAGQNAFVAAEVIRQLLTRYTDEELFHYGMRIHTTVDPFAQSAAHRAIQAARHQAAIVAFDPGSGRILALDGGKDYRQSQFNRATQARRQPGSAFKPFVFGAALERGFTPATLLSDTARIYTTGPDDTWAPKNFDEVYHGTTTLRPALAFSLNAATLDLADRVGPSRIRKFAQRLGIESPLEVSLAMAIGASEVTLAELTAAYAPFANGGFRVRPTLVTAVFDADDRLLEYSVIERSPVLDTAVAGLMTSLLESVVTVGTARRLGFEGWKRPAAGKTGTTDDGRDAWFIGYTPELLAGVWAGDDRNIPIQAVGSKDALPIWADFMHASLADYPPAPFPEPQGLVEARIDPMNGLLAVSGCPEKKVELFVAGTEPTQSCAAHQGGVRGWLRRLFSKN